jgi:hypothetical protein
VIERENVRGSAGGKDGILFLPAFVVNFRETSPNPLFEFKITHPPVQKKFTINKCHYLLCEEKTRDVEMMSMECLNKCSNLYQGNMCGANLRNCGHRL